MSALRAANQTLAHPFDGMDNKLEDATEDTLLHVAALSSLRAGRLRVFT